MNIHHPSPSTWIPKNRVWYIDRAFMLFLLLTLLGVLIKTWLCGSFRGKRFGQWRTFSLAGTKMERCLAYGNGRHISPPKKIHARTASINDHYHKIIVDDNKYSH